ncbi:hypothetical protein SAMN04487917_10639 [Arthrobacter sp. yr096]|uniref:hypothetical protein n=1 Tax=Arthrobacter sp. yr096 TaxID=1761750 RepID=UPI0008C66C5D|nr:hypothetical protein [Arthrobacter sp. yr096]SEJ46320.1 hypothetical protein SAMN04487917_10639 [Arthrobacter sp. yr096]
MITKTRTRTPGRLLPLALLVAALTLSACSLPTPVAQSTPSASAEAPAAEVGTSSATPSAASPEATTGTGGVYGEFTSMSEACLSVSATMLSLTILPLAGLVGGNPDDIEKAKQELSQMQGKVPDELKPAFEKLRAFTESAGSDFSKYGDGKFEELMKPIQDWMDKNCK